MRPHLLTFGGIGPYPGKVEINFDDLSAMGLYLIVGPTGSGKTTIFDAMTFALYGKTSSNREGMFVSDHDGRVDPFVEFTFSHQGRRFIAHREPARARDKNPIPGRQWFREVDGAGKELKTETGSKSVDDAVKSLLGLDAAQFMQVILLPQGKFQEFLMAKSKDRQPLLQKIFGTTLYLKIALHLKDAAIQLRKDAEQINIRLDQERGTARTILESLADEEFAIEFPDPDDGLLPVIELLKTEFARLDAVAKASAAVLEKCIKSESTATEEARRFDAAAEKKELDAAQKAASPSVFKAKVQLEAHERAVRISDLSESATELSESAEISRGLAETTRSMLSKSLGKLTISAEAARGLISAVPTASPGTLTTEVGLLHAKVTKVIQDTDEMDGLLSSVKSWEKTSTSLAKSITEQEGLLKKSQKNIEISKKALKESTAATKKLPALENKLEKIDDLHEAADVGAAQKALIQATEALTGANEAVAAAERKLEDARTSRTMHLAGELASALKTDTECPVCGSTNHPKKAKKTSEVDIDKLEKLRDGTHKKKLTAEQQVTEYQKEVELAQKAKSQLPTATEEKSLRKQYSDLSELAENEDLLSEEIEEHSETIESCQAQIKEEQIELKGAKTNIETATKRITVLEPLASSLGPIKPVIAAEVILTEAKTLIQKLEGLENDSRSKTAKSTEAQTQLDKTIKTEKFSSLKEALSSCLDEDQTSELEASIEEFEIRASDIVRLTGTIGESALPKTRPDLEMLAAATLEARNAGDLATSSSNKTGIAINQLEMTQVNIADLGPESEAKRERAQTASAIAATIEHGSGVGTERQLGLEEWVQRTLFEEVCLVATSQLQLLSNNRYVLTLDADTAKAVKRAGGLEIYVLDSHNGKTRSVQTLSGGEQFLTSLALALALAEVVERHAGGMELSALFIDEGFGSLDGDALDSAMDVLLRLHDSGRTVGVITHVETMQQQLPVGIRINKTSTGSTLDVLASS